MTMETGAAAAAAPPELVALRRERRLLAVLKRVAQVVGWSEILLFVWLVIVQERRDFGFVALSLHGAITNLSVLVVWRVRALPRLVLDLVSADPARRARAASVIEAHRHEVLATTDLPAHRDDPDLVDMPVDAVAARVTKTGPHADWRRIGRIWLAAWAVSLAAVAAGVVALVV